MQGHFLRVADQQAFAKCARTQGRFRFVVFLPPASSSSPPFSPLPPPPSSLLSPPSSLLILLVLLVPPPFCYLPPTMPSSPLLLRILNVLLERARRGYTVTLQGPAGSSLFGSPPRGPEYQQFLSPKIFVLERPVWETVYSGLNPSFWGLEEPHQLL